MRIAGREGKGCQTPSWRQIGGMGGIAMATVLLERWHYAHHLTGSEHLALAWHEVEPTQWALEGLLQRGGDTGGLLQTKTQATLSRYLTQESLVIAFQDCFIVVAPIFVAAAIVSLGIPGGKAKDSRSVRCSLGVTRRRPMRSYGTVATTGPWKSRRLALNDQEEKGC